MLDGDTLVNKSTGGFSLNDKVQKWLPEFRLSVKPVEEQAIVRDLLSHRVGLERRQGEVTYWNSTLSRKEVMEKMGLVKFIYPFRTGWSYSNASFLMAGEIIPRVTGIQWEDYLKQRLFYHCKWTIPWHLRASYPEPVIKVQPIRS